MNEPEATAPAATEETSKSERRFGWMVIGLSILPLGIGAFFGFVHDLWWPLMLLLIGDLYTVYAAVKAFRHAKQLEAEGR